MKFPTDRPVKVVMLGAGGTGGYVAPYVFRLLHMLDRPARFVVCDGDIVEPKNLDRQNFVPADLGENKARVLAERYSTVLGMETEYVPSFIEKLPDLMELIEPKEWELNPYSTKRTKEMVLLLGCVDNNKTRQLCHQAFHQSEELIYIDSGNGKYTGQVVCGVRRNGRTIRKSIGGVHPEMLKDTDLFPSEISCAEAAQEDPQSIQKLLEAFDKEETIDLSIIDWDAFQIENVTPENYERVYHRVFDGWIQGFIHYCRKAPVFQRQERSFF